MHNRKYSIRPALIGHLCRIGYIMSEPGLVPEFHFLDFAHLVGHGVEIQGDPVDTGFRNGVRCRVFSDGEGHVACVELVVAAFVVGNAEITRRQLREAFENARFTADIQIVTSLRNQTGRALFRAMASWFSVAEPCMLTARGTPSERSSRKRSSSVLFI